ncbi:EF-hand domain-containing protein [Alteromonas ponticola]|uniref:EF-hand domain-containing protein n=1 Tax=Alteromonas ponticola TaxID=2720613 RepID=A0ABX1R8G1_9ALTE|nr:EF-hand domain-containing protein [Alteromonas ponticola]NMH61540.1 EF-hand domain-containing protein [Alteromonas ponticola]
MNKLLTIIAVSTVAAACTPADENVKINTNFAELDKDQSGFLTENETESQAIASYFEKIDVDLDNQISVNEFNDYLTTTPEVFDENVQTAAKIELEDNSLSNDSIRSDDNEYNVDEMNAKSEDEFSPETDEELLASSEFEMMDIDRNGEVSKSEAARSGIVEEFNRMDENNDQLITMVEFSNYQNRTLTKGDGE